MHVYDAKDIRRLLGLPASTVRALARAGNIHPVRRDGRLHYSFHDLVILRTASALRAARISSQRINRTLKELRRALPGGAALGSLSLTALGNRIAIREGQTLREPDSGQYALALEIIERQGQLHVIARDEHYARAYALEDGDPAAAQAAYQACLEAEPDHLEARINLGRLLHMAGRLGEAEQVYRAAAPDPLLLFNLAILLEDRDREADAIESYRAALALDPQLADAHFNLARLHERARDPKASLRHLLAYRRLIGRQGT